MRIGLIDIDGHNFPNIPLMKLSAYHKAHGNSVEWYQPLLSGHMDVVYMAKVFSFTPDYGYPIDADRIIKGGTGYHIKLRNGKEAWEGTETKLPEEVIIGFRIQDSGFSEQEVIMGMRGRPRKSAGSGQVAAGSTVDQLSVGDQETGDREQGATLLPSPVKCPPVRLLTTELDGFRVFEPKRNLAGEDVIRLLINRDGCRITQRCAEILRGPDYVIAFFDEKGKRLMLKPAEKGMANAIHLKTKSAKIYPSIIKLSSFRNELLRVAEINPKSEKYFAAAGHQANVIQPTLIFDLGHLQVREVGNQ